MLDLGWSEVMVVAALAIIIVGPRDFPRVLRTINGYVRKIRGLAGEFQGAMDEVARQADLDDIKKQVQETQTHLDAASALGKNGLQDSKAENNADSLSDLGSNLRGISDDIKKAVFNDGAPKNSASAPLDISQDDAQNPASENSLARAARRSCPCTTAEKVEKTDISDTAKVTPTPTKNRNQKGYYKKYQQKKLLLKYIQPKKRP